MMKQTDEPQTNQVEKDIQKLPNWEKPRLTLRGRLLLRVVPTVLGSLFVAGLSGWLAINNSIKNQNENNLQEQSLLASKVSNETLSNLLNVSRQVGKSPLVIAQTKEISEQVEQLPSQSLEVQAVSLNSQLNQYLQGLTTPQTLGETNPIRTILVTEKQGFNVAYTETPTNLVHQEKTWWQNGQSRGEWVGDFQVNEATQQTEINLVRAIRDPDTGDFLGVIKMSVLGSAFEVIAGYWDNQTLLDTTQIQVLDTSANQVFTTITKEGAVTESSLEGGEALQEIARSLIAGLEEEARRSAPEQVAEQYDLSEQYGLQETNLEQGTQDGRLQLRFNFLYQGRKYYLATIPQTDWVAISSVESQVLQAAGSEGLIEAFLLAGGGLVVVTVGLVVVWARQLSSPLTNVSQSAEKAASGDLSVRAQPQGGVETHTLAKSFNNLVERVQGLLQEQEASNEQQRRQREQLEAQVSQLMSEMEGASEGDLTVRARLLEGDMGIVADLFNSVVENLQDTARQVKDAATQVNTSLGENEEAIREVAESAIAQAEEIQTTLNSVEEMTASIETVADNAQKAANIADTAFLTAQEGNETMDETVERIQGLRKTVGETATQMQEMGESASQISEVVSIIDEISLKTTLLAMNASLEAQQAGEAGKGFTAIAQQIESLSQRSATGAQQIAQIVDKIQHQSEQTIQAMEQGNQEVLASARSVEKTKERLSTVVQRSEEINNLMQSISHSTISQAETSQRLSKLMEQVAQSSQNRSQTARKVAQGIQETTQVSQTLEASVAEFKVEKGDRAIAFNG